MICSKLVISLQQWESINLSISSSFLFLSAAPWL